MDITPQLLKEVKFSESWRGYDRDEVDEFLERVGAGVALVQGRLREAIERAEAAESRAQAMGSRSEAEETLKRTLVLAQRTADAAVAEANETAARTISEAEARAQRMIADAEAHAAVLRAEAEAEVRRVIESTRAPLIEEIKELERVRNFLRDDIELLENHLAAQRERLRGQLGEIAALLDEPSMLRPEPTPETSGVDPDAALSSLSEPAPVVTPAEPAPAVSEPVVADAPTATAPPPPPAPDAGAAAPPRIDTGEHDLRPGAQPGGPVAFDAAPVGVATAPSSRGWDDAGPPTQPVAIADIETQSDSFLDQLRRAVDDDPDDDVAMTAFFDQDDEERPRSRFGRRR